jgi:exopolysaccharide biosynthesis WecB/TagA/CpsF family protein
MAFLNSIVTSSPSASASRSDHAVQALPGPPVIRLLELDFADLTLPGVLHWAVARPVAAPFGFLATPNADHLVRLCRDPAVRALYLEAAMRLLDSRVVARLAGLAGLPVPPVVPGSDLTARLIEDVVTPGEPVTILGVPAEAVAVLRRRYGLRQVAHLNPPMGFDRDPGEFDRAVRFIEENPARFTFLAVGSPRQCRVAAAVARRGRATGLGLCIGASLLFLTGHERRAPLLVQQAGMEWAWRLAQDPRRMARRYLVESPAIIRLLRADARRRGAHGPPAPDAA